MKKALFIITLVLSSLFVSAQTNSPFTGALLWKVSGNDLKEPSYILGTFHLFSSNFVDSIPMLREVIQETQQVVGELDMADMEAMQMQLMQAAVLAEEESYKNLLSEEEYSKLDEGLKSIMGVGLDQMGGFKPGMIGTSLSGILYMKVNPEFNPVNFEAIDAYLQRLAQEAEKPVIGLETVDSQIHLLFDAQPQRFQMESLLCSLEHLEDGVESMESLIEDYRQGNLNKMYNDSFHNPEDPCSFFSQASKDGMLKDRNDKWIGKLPNIMSENTSLIVVGALHLAAEEGILHQLNQLGYKVEPVR